MTGHNSESELAGRLGASLTPRVSPSLAQGSEQNSGVIDIRTLYAASAPYVSRRAPVARAEPQTVAPSRPLVEYVDLEPDDLLYVLPRRRSWLGTTVVLLMFALGGVAIVDTVPAPLFAPAKATIDAAALRARATIETIAPRAHSTIRAVAMRTWSTIEARIGRSQPPVAGAPPIATTPVLAVSPAVAAEPILPNAGMLPATAPPALTPPSTAPPSVVAAPVEAKGHLVSLSVPPTHASDPRAPRSHAKAPGGAQPQPLATAARRAPAPAASAKGDSDQGSPDAEPTKPAPGAVKESVKAQPVAPAAAADSKPTSLEDLIRKEVQAESKRGH
jgi:hypothetical protein